MLNFSDLLPYTDQLLKGLWVTVELTVYATLGGVAIGTAGAAGRHYGGNLLRGMIGMYVELIRNTPFIVQLFFIFFGLPALGIKLSAWEAGLIAMLINLGAYSTEIIRAGLAATPKGQVEAAKVLGLSPQQAFFRVVLIPAFEKIYPALTSQCIIVMLGSAVVSQISVMDLTYAANLIQSRNFRSFEVYLVVAAMYLVLAILMRQAFDALGRYLFRHRRSS
ncbi:MULTISPECIES: amino acid ABC transporter permease [Nitrincola]|uniref:L-cystine transport system permease protein tcyB n=1 Tax=Nitrincola nitratireducens TaxID=1229521 RepID=W9V6I7_9GAMM|nr:MULTISPECIES: amino acid ABC transporter permease [Nitrincola]EXJ12516.1 L-cystine transport system permease protein tcyB [Nitrincola nitratireducens]